MKALRQNASENAVAKGFYVTKSEPVSSPEPINLKSEECETFSIKSSKKLSPQQLKFKSGEQIYEYLENKFKNVKIP